MLLVKLPNFDFFRKKILIKVAENFDGTFTALYFVHYLIKQEWTFYNDETLKHSETVKDKIGNK